MLENEKWLKADVDYISRTTDMHAVWPSLDHGLFEWAMIEDGGILEDIAPQEPCQHPRVIQCGITG